jgi:hypothetical protein
LACQLQAINVRHIDIRQQQINRLISVGTKGQRLPTIAGRYNSVACGFQYQFD